MTQNPAFAPGTVLLDKYQIVRVLGRGGMGIVAAATHIHLGEAVAVKFLQAQFAGDHVVTQRFLREAQAAVKLKGEHSTRVIDVGLLDDGTPFMVMELLRGQDLAQLLARGALPVGIVIDHVLQACEALAEAHAIGIVHRDLKPSNLFVTARPDGSPLVKVLDFGISKMVMAGGEGLTSTNTILGTPGYMSPEQLRAARDVDGRTDIWSLGVILYEALCGRRPFEAKSFAVLCLKAASEPTPPMTGVPRGLAQIVHRCLEKDAARRFQTVAELATALAPYAAHQRGATTIVERTRAMQLGDAELAAMALAPTLPGAFGPADPRAPSLTPSGPGSTRGLLSVVAGVAALVTGLLLAISG